MPAALDSPSGTFEMNTAATTDTLTAPPPSNPMPMTTDSGMPSSRAPIAIAVPLPCCSSSDGWAAPGFAPERFRCRAPRRARADVAAK